MCHLCVWLATHERYKETTTEGLKPQVVLNATVVVIEAPQRRPLALHGIGAEHGVQ
jgi:hypothetical protein